MYNRNHFCVVKGKYVLSLTSTSRRRQLLFVSHTKMVAGTVPEKKLEEIITINSNDLK